MLYILSRHVYIYISMSIKLIDICTFYSCLINVKTRVFDRAKEG